MKLYFTKTDIPHGYLCATPIHLTYRVKNCAPITELKAIHKQFMEQLDVLKQLGNSSSDHFSKIRKAHFEAYDALLDAQDQTRFVLAKQKAAEIVINSWLDLQQMKRIVLYAVCVMGNHVHVLLRGIDDGDELPIGQVVRQHKTYTNKLIKDALNLSENVWDDGFYDRYVRPGSFWSVLEYILQNPVAANLVSNWNKWPNTYVDERCLR